MGVEIEEITMEDVEDFPKIENQTKNRKKTVLKWLKYVLIGVSIISFILLFLGLPFLSLLKNDEENITFLKRQYTQIDNTHQHHPVFIDDKVLYNLPYPLLTILPLKVFQHMSTLIVQTSPTKSTMLHILAVERDYAKQRTEIILNFDYRLILKRNVAYLAQGETIIREWPYEEDVFDLKSLELTEEEMLLLREMMESVEGITQRPPSKLYITQRPAISDVYEQKEPDFFPTQGEVYMPFQMENYHNEAITPNVEDIKVKNQVVIDPDKNGFSNLYRDNEGDRQTVITHPVDGGFYREIDNRVSHDQDGQNEVLYDQNNQDSGATHSPENQKIGHTHNPENGQNQYPNTPQNKHIKTPPNGDPNPQNGGENIPRTDAHSELTHTEESAIYKEGDAEADTHNEGIHNQEKVIYKEGEAERDPHNELIDNEKKVIYKEGDKEEIKGESYTHMLDENPTQNIDINKAIEGIISQLFENSSQVDSEMDRPHLPLSPPPSLSVPPHVIYPTKNDPQLPYLSIVRPALPSIVMPYTHIPLMHTHTPKEDTDGEHPHTPNPQKYPHSGHNISHHGDLVQPHTHTAKNFTDVEHTPTPHPQKYTGSGQAVPEDGHPFINGKGPLPLGEHTLHYVKPTENQKDKSEFPHNKPHDKENHFVNGKQLILDFSDLNTKTSIQPLLRNTPTKIDLNHPLEADQHAVHTALNGPENGVHTAENGGEDGVHTAENGGEGGVHTAGNGGEDGVHTAEYVGEDVFIDESINQKSMSGEAYTHQSVHTPPNRKLGDKSGKKWQKQIDFYHKIVSKFLHKAKKSGSVAVEIATKGLNDIFFDSLKILADN